MTSKVTADEMTIATHLVYQTSSVSQVQTGDQSDDETRAYFDINASDVAHLNENYAQNLLPVSLSWGTLALVGVLGNSAVLLVYGLGRHARNKSYRSLILFLAAVDFFTCAILIPTEIVKHRFYFSAKKMPTCRVKCAFNMFALISTTFLLLVIAVDRYSAVSDPLQRYKKGAPSRKSAFIKCLIVLVVSVVSSIPAAILCGSSVVTLTTEYGEVRAYTCAADEEWRYSLFRYLYKYSLSISQVIVSVIIIVLYCRIGCIIKQKLRKKSSRLPSVTVSMDENSKLEKTVHISLPSNIKALFVVTITFIVTFFLFAVLSFFNISKFSDSYPAYVFFLRLYFMQSVATPLMYVKMDKKFRYSALTLFYKKQARKTSSSSQCSV